MVRNILKGANLLLFAAIIAFYFAMNMMIPKWSDDMCYQYKYVSIFNCTPTTSPMGTELNAPVESFGDAISSNVIQYVRFNGRAVVHTFVQYFCMFDSKIPYSMVTCALFGFLLLFLGRYITYKRQAYFSYLYPLLILTFLSGSRCMYNGIATGVNYVWALSFCVIYVALLCNNSESKWHKYMLLFMAVLGGFSHEAISVTISGGLLFLWYKEKKSLPKYKILSIYFFVSGTVLLLFAPSNVFRFLGETSANDPVELRLAFFESLRWFYLLMLSAVVLRIKGKLKEFFSENQYVFVSLLVGSLFVLFVGASNTRTVFFIDAIAGVLFFRSLYFMFPGSRHTLLYPLYPLIILLLVPIYTQLYKYQREPAQIISHVAIELDKTKEKNVILPIKNVHVPLYLDNYIYRLQPEKDFWNIEVYKWRYKKETIEFKYYE